jgi:hypothetical protein
VKGAEARADAAHDREEQSLGTALGHSLDEARMVLPGVQALFGFQLIAVFNDGFERRLSGAEQQLHLAAIVLVTIAIALLMTPAAYHQQVDRRRATAAFLTLAARLVVGAMLPLAAGLAIDVHLVARVITGTPLLGVAIGGAVFAMFLFLWFVFPQWRLAHPGPR